MKKAGRPKIKYDYELLRRLAQIQCTNVEIAAVLCISVDTIENRMKDDPEFSDALKGRDEGKMSLRRALWQNALKGNTSLLIWLSKQHLGMKEPQYADKPDSGGTLDDMLARLDESRRKHGMG